MLRKQSGGIAILRAVAALCEGLESRRLLSVSAPGLTSADKAYPTFVLPAQNANVSAPFTPSEISTAYGLNEISFSGTPGTGSGQTIAIIDAYNDPDIVSDATTFNNTYGLPAFNTLGNPTFTVENQNGVPFSPAGTLPAGLTNSARGTWDLEESLDVEWAHSVAPMANIILFEANTNNDSDLYAAVDTVRNTVGVSVVSMSFDGGEYNGETSEDYHFTTPSGHAGVTFLASTGDDGAPAGYPAVSPNVVAVGGTSLTINSDGSYGGETGWSGSGGGVSDFESQPLYQENRVSAFSTTQRTTPDVAWLANPNTGVIVLDSYDSYDGGVGGTSLACPMWAGMISIIDQGLALNGTPALDGPSQTLPMLYNFPSSDFHDITSGSNGFPAGVGYDLVTGLGSPIGAPGVASQAPSITSANSVTFAPGTAASFGVTTTGVPIATITEMGALPSGITFQALSDGTANLAGDAAAGSVGIYNITFSASNGVAPGATQTFTLTIGHLPGITSANHVTFINGTASSFTVTTTGSPAPALTETGALPSGVTFTDNGNGTASLAGTPEVPAGGKFNLTFTASNGLLPNAIQDFTLTIDVPPTITSASQTTFTTGTSGSFTITTTGYPIPAFADSGALPTGVTFKANPNGTATIAGTPAAGTGGTYDMTVVAKNNVLPNATQTFILTVDQAPAITSVNHLTLTTGTAASLTVMTTGFPAPAVTETGGLPGGVTFTNNGNGTATLAGTALSGSGGIYTLTLTASNGTSPNATQTFTLTVDDAPVITSANNATFTSGTSGSILITTTGFPTSALTEAGALPSGVTFTNNGNGTATLGGAAAAGTGGIYNLTLTANNGVSPNATQAFTLTVDQAPAITSANQITFTTGTADSITVTTTGFPAPALTETGVLPSGVTFMDNGNGTATLAGTTLSGSGGIYNLTLTANNGVSPNTTQAFTLTVDQAPAFTSSNQTTFTIGTADSITVTTTGFPTSTLTETGALPSGVTFMDNGDGTATLAGTPAAGTGGTYNLTLTADNGVSPNATQDFTLTVTASTPQPDVWTGADGTTNFNDPGNWNLDFVPISSTDTVINSGTVVAPTGLDVASLTLGTNSLSTPASLQLASGGGGGTVTSLTIFPGSTLDITNNPLIVSYGSPANDPATMLQQYLANGYNGGAWTGAGGIVSSTAAANAGLDSIGYADADNPADATAATNAGLTPGSNQFIALLAAAGDVNLDGTVNFKDLGVIAQNFGKSGDWAQGDLNYDGTVNFKDLGIVAQNFGKSLASAQPTSVFSDQPILATDAAEQKDQLIQLTSPLAIL